MIVKILKATAKFDGVRYNTNKTESGKGELMGVSGFGPLQAYSQLKPEDYVNYLEMVSAGNKRVKLPQFHAVISDKERDSSKEELTDLAKAWLEKMGYGEQPYLIVFHKDTKNNHVHIVSTRVNKEGKKISSAFEKIRAVTQLNRVMQQDEYQMAKQDISKALAYKFSTKPQFMLILESKGYVVQETGGRLELIKFGKKLAELNVSTVKERIASAESDQARAVQLTAFFHKYRTEYSGVLREDTTALPGGLEKGNASYTSDLAVHLKKTFGLELVFHGKVGKPAYGYTVIDHAEGNVYKGGEIMDIADLTAVIVLENKIHALESEEELGLAVPDVDRSFDGLAYPEITVLQLDSLPDFSDVNATGSVRGAEREEVFEPYQAPVTINISDDIDDEQILGRNRRRKRKARTNTR